MIGTGTDAAPPVAPNATIAGKEPFEITDLMQQMGGTIARVNDTIDALQDDVQRAVVGLADSVEKTNTLIADVSGDLKLMAASGAKIAERRRSRSPRACAPGRGPWASSSTTTSCTPA